MTVYGHHHLTVVRWFLLVCPPGIPIHSTQARLRLLSERRGDSHLSDQSWSLDPQLLPATFSETFHTIISIPICPCPRLIPFRNSAAAEIGGRGCPDLNEPLMLVSLDEYGDSGKKLEVWAFGSPWSPMWNSSQASQLTEYSSSQSTIRWPWTDWS